MARRLPALRPQVPAPVRQPREIIRAHQYPVVGRDTPDALRLGRYFNPDAERIEGRMAYGGERNALIFGPNGSGKGTCLLAPNLLQCRDRSMFVVDPKAELAAITAPFRRTLGPVYVINPFGVMLDVPGYEDLASCGYNPLAALDPDLQSFNTRAALLADALIMIEGKDPHWDRSARSLLAALIMYVVLEAHGRLTPQMRELTASIPASPTPGVPTMARVRELLCLASAEPSARNNHLGEGLPTLALAMMASGIPGLRNKASQFVEWTNEVRSIASTAKAQTEFLDDNEIADDLGKDGLRFEQLKREPVTVYLILPPDMMERHAKWLRMLITSAIMALMKPRRRGEPKTLFMLDEFAALGHMQIIETAWALVRGYGIQILPVFQDLTQLKTIYQQRWETFVGMAGAIACFAPNDLTTAEWISERAGDTTRDVVSRSNNVTRTSGTSSGTSDPTVFGAGHSSVNSGSHSSLSESSTSNATPTKVRLAHRHSLFGLRPGGLIVFGAGASNFLAGYAAPYWDIAECNRRARANPYHLGS